MTVLESFDPMVWMAAGYGVFLILAAHLLDRMARRTANKVTDWRSGAFVYHQDHDAWVCPEDHWLWPQSFDPDNRVMRYRASPTVCNACPVKDTCTSSDSGREISRNVDPWPSAESERFHRGIACTVAVLALLWPAGMALIVQTWAERGVLAGAVLLVAALSVPLLSHLRRSPANFPELVPTKSLDDVEAERARTQAWDARRGSGYGSDRRRPTPVDLGIPDPGAPDLSAGPARTEHDRFATRWGAFQDADALPETGWSRRSQEGKRGRQRT